MSWHRYHTDRPTPEHNQSHMEYLPESPSAGVIVWQRYKMETETNIVLKAIMKNHTWIKSWLLELRDMKSGFPRSIPRPSSFCQGHSMRRASCAIFSVEGSRPPPPRTRHAPEEPAEDMSFI